MTPKLLEYSNQCCWDVACSVVLVGRISNTHKILLFLSVGLWHCFSCISCSKHFWTDFHYFNFYLSYKFDSFWSFFLQNSMSRTVKLSSSLFISRATRNSFFQTERVHGSAFSEQNKHFRILVPNLKYMVLSPASSPRSLYTNTGCGSRMWRFSVSPFGESTSM